MFPSGTSPPTPCRLCDCGVHRAVSPRGTLNNSQVLTANSMCTLTQLAYGQQVRRWPLTTPPLHVCQGVRAQPWICRGVQALEQADQRCRRPMLRCHMQRFSRKLQSLPTAWVRQTCSILQNSQCAYADASSASTSPYRGVKLAECKRCCSSAPAPSATCWQCGNHVDEASCFFCSQCKSILPPAVQPDLFRMMGL